MPHVVCKTDEEEQYFGPSNKPISKRSGDIALLYVTRADPISLVALDHSLVIRDVKIIEGPKGLFVAMPSKKQREGTYRDIVHPVNPETRKMIEGRVIEEYNNLLARSSCREDQAPGDG